MKISPSVFGRADALAVALAVLTVSTWAQDRPEITAVRLEGTNIVVVATVPPGLRKLTVESRTRVGAGAWVPQLVVRLDGSGGEETFRLPRKARLEMLRVRADVTEPFPAQFYEGTNSFAGPPNGGFRGDVPGPVNAGPGDAADGEAGRAVVESDIWKLVGDTLYFFNQYRGLQIIDVTNPDAPQLRGTLDLPATGEQMYVTGNFAVLLTRECNYLGASSSSVLVVDVSGNTPTVVSRLAVEGTIQESRLVGTALYVASETYRAVDVDDPDGGNTGEWGSVVSSFDLANPAAPVAKDTLWFTGSGNVVTATDRFLFVSVRDVADWWHSSIHVIDITDEHGAMKPQADVEPLGQVPDKFKMNLTGDVFTVVSESWADKTQWMSVLENFSLADPQAPAKLGSVVIKAGERLFATRFDGQRAYVVTFQRIDPLFVVDLADPTQPRVAGEVEVPGWSTYLHPLGDRLVTIGIETTNGWRVAVSLFDVKDPAKPKQLSRVPVGENYSWSEANYDEKAFGILPEIGLLLVPYQGYTTNGYASRVQLIDLGADSLTARGAIDHNMVPRRATVHRDRVLSLSGVELLSVDAADRDHPVVKSALELAWRVDRVVLAGDHVFEFAQGNGWDSSESFLRVATAAKPDRILQEKSLGSFPVLGATVRDGFLYVLQGKTEWWWPGADDTNPPPPTETNVTMTLFDLGALPELHSVGQVDIAARSLGWGTDWDALWIKPDLLVWAGGGGYSGWWGMVDVARPAGDFWWPSYGGQGGRLLAFDVATAASPALVSDLNLIGNDRWNFSPAFAADGLVFVSHESSEFLEGVVPPGYVPPAPDITKDPVSGQWVTNDVPVGTWVQKYYLDVVDYADAANPTVRKPVSLPGRLNGLSHGGGLLYTVGPRFDPVKWTTDWSEWLAASAYDGVAAHLVDTFVLPQAWPHPLLVQGAHVLIGRPATNTDTKNLLEAWTLSGSGQFLRVGSTELQSPAQSLAAFGDLLAIQGAGDLALYNAANPAALSLIRSDAVPGCVWFNLSFADGSLEKGLWVPLYDFGTLKLAVP